MKPETQDPMPYHPDRSDCRELLTAVFGLVSPEVGQIEWLFDRIEGRSAANAGARTWA